VANVLHGTEWCGFDGGELYPPKSFDLFAPAEKSLAYKGLLYFLEGLASKENVRLGKQTDLDVGSQFFAEVVAGKTIAEVSRKLNLHYKPTFEYETKNSSAIRGKIDFSKGILRNLGLQHKHVVTFSTLAYSDPLISFLKFAVPFVSNRIIKFFGSATSKELCRESAVVENLLESTKVPKDPFLSALEIVYDSLAFNQKFIALLPEARILAHFVLFTSVGMGETGRFKGDGLLLNLNRPFESLLRNCLLATEKFRPVNERLNEIFLGENRASFVMRPDCKGWLNINGKETFVILDAKHKIMEGEVQDDVDATSINRNDFYQIISYAMTHSFGKTGDCRYMLVGLRAEAAPTTQLIQTLPPINVRHSDETLSIGRATLNFGSILYQIGKRRSQGQEIDSLLQELGHNLIDTLGIEFSNTDARVPA
jgi:hypothetical protein